MKRATLGQQRAGSVVCQDHDALNIVKAEHAGDPVLGVEHGPVLAMTLEPNGDLIPMRIVGVAGSCLLPSASPHHELPPVQLIDGPAETSSGAGFCAHYLQSSQFVLCIKCAYNTLHICFDVTCCLWARKQGHAGHVVRATSLG